MNPNICSLPYDSKRQKMIQFYYCHLHKEGGGASRDEEEVIPPLRAQFVFRSWTKRRLCFSVATKKRIQHILLIQTIGMQSSMFVKCVILLPHVKGTVKSRPLIGYVYKEDVTSNMREVLVDWLAEVADEYKLF